MYERVAGEWTARRRPPDAATTRAGALAAALGPGPVLDAGCGPGWFGPALGTGGRTVVALDAAASMLRLAAVEAPTALRVRADLRALPFRRGSLAGAWASKSYVHLRRTEVPSALADLHAALAPGAQVDLRLFEGDDDHGEVPGDEFPGRRFSLWPEPLVLDVVHGAGFDVDGFARRRHPGGTDLLLRLRRARTLADSVGPGMRLLLVGLNPSLYAADVGVGFARPGNRFWPAALRAGLVDRDRDPRHARVAHGIGMTDMVKRATVGAAELTAVEYRDGLARLDRLCRWLEPDRVCIIGLAGWRAAADRRSTSGWHPRGVGGRPVYVMPNPSGLNASSSLDDLVAHLRAAAHGAPMAPTPPA